VACSEPNISADIAAQYEKLNIDLAPSRIVVTRESERGTDVIGNTIVKLTLVQTPPTGMSAADTVFLVTSQHLFDGGKPLEADAAEFDVDEIGIPLRCPLYADLTTTYLLRHVMRGTEYYTEGKQVVQIVDGTVSANPQLLVRAAETQQPLWQILYGHGALIVRGPDTLGHQVLFDNFSAAESFAAWLKLTHATGIGKDGLSFSPGSPGWGAKAGVARFNLCCPGTPCPEKTGG
jgi:hypothetical protein